MMNFINKLPRWLVLELLIPLTLLNGWLLLKGFQYFQSLFTILLVATLLSFLLGYPVRLLQRWGLARGYSIMVVCIVVIAISVVAGTALIPTLFQQYSEFTTQLPDWIESGQQQLQSVDTEIAELPMGEAVESDVLITQFFEAVPGQLKLLPNQILSFALGTADTVLNSLFMLVLTLYSLLHGESFWRGLLRWLPNGFCERMQQSVQSQFQSYFIGQATIAGTKGTLLTVVFLLFNLPFWLVFGLVVAIASLIPFGDLLTMITISLLVGVNDPVLGVEVFVASLLLVQLVDNIVAPKILGEALGLNPMWILLALLAGSQIGGLLGVIIAVPVAGSIRQIIEDVQNNKEPKDALA